MGLGVACGFELVYFLLLIVVLIALFADLLVLLICWFDMLWWCFCRLVWLLWVLMLTFVLGCFIDLGLFGLYFVFCLWWIAGCYD